MFTLSQNELAALDSIVINLYDLFTGNTPIPLTINRKTGDVSLNIPAMIGEREAIAPDRLHIEVVCSSVGEWSQDDRYELVMSYDMGTCGARGFLAVTDNYTTGEAVRRISETLLIESGHKRGKLYAAHKLINAEPKTPNAKGLAAAVHDVDFSVANQDTLSYRYWEWDGTPDRHVFTITTID